VLVIAIMIKVSSPSSSSTGADLDPFEHKLSLGFWQSLKIALMSVTLAPLKLVTATTCFLLAWLVARIGLCGTSTYIESRPLTGWRRRGQDLCFWLARAMFFSAGVLWVKTKGRKESSAVAPMMVCAPHSTLLDTLVGAVTKCCPLTKIAIKTAPFMGSMAKFWQIPFVDRKSPDKRKVVVDLVRKRAKDMHQGGWRQIIFYPEGTTTNGKALLRFKCGAFVPGLAVQPVLLRIDNNPDVARWTWKQSYGALTSIWLILCQCYINFEVKLRPYFSVGRYGEPF